MLSKERLQTVTGPVGSWSLPCRSHYVIKKGNIRWAGDWTDEQIDKGRRADLARKRDETPVQPKYVQPLEGQKAKRPNILQRVWAAILNIR